MTRLAALLLAAALWCAWTGVPGTPRETWAWSLCGLALVAGLAADEGDE